MEKRGDIVVQLALISDLMEKMNIESDSKSIIINLKNEEFFRVHSLITKKFQFDSNQTKNKKQTKLIDNKFTLEMGEVVIVFNNYNV